MNRLSAEITEALAGRAGAILDCLAAEGALSPGPRAAPWVHRRRVGRHPPVADGPVGEKHLTEIAALLDERGVDLAVLTQGILPVTSR